MIYLLYSFCFVVFFVITWLRFEYGLFLFFLLLPTYIIRFSIFGIPTTFLEILFLIILSIYLITKRKEISTINYKQFFKENKLLFISTLLFVTSATISIFTSVDIRSALGEWKAFYIEPIILFIILTSSYSKSKITQNYILLGLLLCGLLTSLLAIYQHFTGWMVPYAFWENRETYRVTAWYGFPNGVGLFLAPLVPLAIYYFKIQRNKIFGHSLIQSRDEQDTNNLTFKKTMHIITLVSCFLFLVSSIFAIFFAKSTGAIIGIMAGVGFLLLVYKKTRWPTLVVGLLSFIGLLSLPSLQPIKDEILFQDRSGQIRLAIYSETKELLRDRPILGAGLASYEERIEPYHGKVNGESIEIFHHPHNIFLTMWVNTGLIGLIGFLGIILWCFIKSYKVTKLRSNKTIQYQQLPITNYIMASLTTILVTGLVDSPYIKNDLAFLFWTILALLYIYQKDRHSVQDQLQ